MIIEYTCIYDYCLNILGDVDEYVIVSTCKKYIV